MKKLVGTLLVIAVAFFSCAKFTGDPGTDPIGTTRQRAQNNNPGTPKPSTDSLNNVKGSVVLQLVIDSVNTQELRLTFDPNSQTIYTPGVDVLAQQNSGRINLSWLSSDNVSLSAYTMPLKQPGAKIGLRVDAQSDGLYSLNLKALQSIPLPYDLWLKDSFAKDSLELRYNPTYSFNVIKADTGSFGANRFKLVIRLR
ncbi:MAG: hypothetical protein JSU01_07860 [Bacteroidetes bacterium]|nr:hypothetical protein [Bacteroidota bacterium]